MKLTNLELYNTIGGVSFSASLLNAISRLIETTYNIGKSVGTTFKTIFGKKYC